MSKDIIVRTPRGLTAARSKATATKPTTVLRHCRRPGRTCWATCAAGNSWKLCARIVYTCHRASEMIGQLYAVDVGRRPAHDTAEQRRLLRKQKAYSGDSDIEKWYLTQYPSVLAKALLGKAIAYTLLTDERLGYTSTTERVNYRQQPIETQSAPWALGPQELALLRQTTSSACRAAIVLIP